MNLQDVRTVVKKSLKIRVQSKIPFDSSFCVLDLSQEIGTEVRFVDLTSLEGAYLKESKTILLSTYRPEGRIRFTCAHELGHHVFKHGDHFDELVEKANCSLNTEEEQVANLFASFLLMPETTIKSFFVNNKWHVQSPTAQQIYLTSNWLGVSYGSMVNHLFYGLKLIDESKFKKLIKVQPKTIKKDLAGLAFKGNLLVINEYWKGRPIDLQVGDYLLFPGKVSFDEQLVSPVATVKGELYKADTPGVTRVEMPWHESNLMLRVRRKEYLGRSIFRNLSEE
jgi:Zn-dependent peptidase ImmA (M78 family)